MDDGECRVDLLQGLSAIQVEEGHPIFIGGGGRHGMKAEISHHYWFRWMEMVQQWSSKCGYVWGDAT